MLILMLMAAVVRLLDWKGPETAKQYIQGTPFRYLILPEEIYHAAREIGTWFETQTEMHAREVLEASGMTFQLALVVFLTASCLLVDLFILQRYIPSACFNCVHDLLSLPWHLFSAWLLLFGLFKAVRTFQTADISHTNAVQRISVQGTTASETQQSYMRLRSSLGLIKEYILLAFPAVTFLFALGGRVAASAESYYGAVLDSSAVTTLAIYATAGLLSIVITVSLFLETELRDKEGVPLALKPRDQDAQDIALGRQYVPKFTSEHRSPFRHLHDALTNSKCVRAGIILLHEWYATCAGDLRKSAQQRVRHNRSPHARHALSYFEYPFLLIFYVRRLMRRNEQLIQHGTGSNGQFLAQSTGDCLT